MTAPVTLDEWLSAAYTADLKGKGAAAIAAFRTALADSPSLVTAAQSRLVELNALVSARGQSACAYSTKYWNYLNEALEP